VGDQARDGESDRNTAPPGNEKPESADAHEGRARDVDDTPQPVPSPSEEPQASPAPEPAASDEPPRPGVSHWRSPEEVRDAPQVPAEDGGRLDSGIARRAMRNGLGASPKDEAAAGEARASRDASASNGWRRSGEDGEDASEPSVAGPIDPSADPLAGEAGFAAEPSEADEDEIVQAEPADIPVTREPDEDGVIEAEYSEEEFAGTGSDEKDEVSRFEYRAPFTARRNPAKMWTLAVTIFALLAAGTAVAVNVYGLPEFAPFSRPTFGIGKRDLALAFDPAEQRIETLDSGERIYRVRGTISNEGRERLNVPDLLIVFRDRNDELIKNWVVVPAKRELAPGETLNVTEAIADVPQAARVAEVGWAPS
jgi:hypothetical protein